MNRRKKRAVTLIEIMIVILLIGLIGGALAFNMRGSMDQGKVFKSRQNIARVKDALMLKNAEGAELSEIIKNDDSLTKALKDTPFAKSAGDLLKDGWGQRLKFSIDPDKGDLVVESDKLTAWENDHPTK